MTTITHIGAFQAQSQFLQVNAAKEGSEKGHRIREDGLVRTTPITTTVTRTTHTLIRPVPRRTRGGSKAAIWRESRSRRHKLNLRDQKINFTYILINIDINLISYSFLITYYLCTRNLAWCGWQLPDLFPHRRPMLLVSRRLLICGVGPRLSSKMAHRLRNWIWFDLH